MSFGDLREMKRRRTTEVKQDFSFSSFVNVHRGNSSLANSHARHFVDGFDVVHLRFANVGAPLVTHCSDYEIARSFCDSPKVGSRNRGLSLLTLEAIEDIEGRSPRQRVGNPVSYAIIDLYLHRGDAWQLRNTDLDLLRVAVHASLASTRVLYFT